LVCFTSHHITSPGTTAMADRLTYTYRHKQMPAKASVAKNHTPMMKNPSRYSTLAYGDVR
jgi:hypothetical protein